MKKILIAVMMTTTLLTSCEDAKNKIAENHQSKIVIVNGDSKGTYKEATKDMIKELKKDSKIAKESIDILYSYSDLKALEDNYNAIVVINAKLESGYSPDVENLIKSSKDKSKIIVASFYKNYDRNTFVIETNDKSQLGVDTVATTSKQPLSHGTWKTPFVEVWQNITQFVSAKL